VLAVQITKLSTEPDGRSLLSLYRNNFKKTTQSLLAKLSVSIPSSLGLKKNTCMWFGVMVNYNTIDAEVPAA